MNSLNEATSNECSKVLTDASQRIKNDVRHSDAKQKVVTQTIIDTKKTFGEELRKNYEDEREKRKVYRYEVNLLTVT